MLVGAAGSPALRLVQVEPPSIVRQRLFAPNPEKQAYKVLALFGSMASPVHVLAEPGLFRVHFGKAPVPLVV